MREKNFFTFNLIGSYCRVLSRGVTCVNSFKKHHTGCCMRQYEAMVADERPVRRLI